jgi:large subunit ribosomal protein L24
MRSIVKNDNVKVISGNHKGKTGKVIMVIPEKNRVIVEKIQLVKRHTRPRSNTQPGGIIEKEASIHISNVMLVCPNATSRRARAPRPCRMVAGRACVETAKK